MKQINYILIILTLFIPLSKTFATAQVPDRLIYNCDTLSLFANPLEQLYKNDSIRPNFFGNKEGCMTTACWRGYIANWIIIENNLYLTDILSCCYYKDSIKADLKYLFGEKFANGKVKADWFTGDIIAPKGERIFYVHSGYESLYETELEFQFIKGKLIRTKTYDNSKSKQSKYKGILGEKYIYNNINWNELPIKDTTNVKVICKLSANEFGKIDSVVVLKGNIEIFNKEAIRVIKSIPEWEIYYRHGEYKRTYYCFPIYFNLKLKEEYNKTKPSP